MKLQDGKGREWGEAVPFNHFDHAGKYGTCTAGEGDAFWVTEKIAGAGAQSSYNYIMNVVGNPFDLLVRSAYIYAP